MSWLMHGKYVPAADDVVVGRDRRLWLKMPVDVSGVEDKDSPRFSRTQQSFKDDCDVNLIMKRFERTGILEHRDQFEGRYDDFTNVPQSYHEAVNQVIAAQDMFQTVPARIRAIFQNDPGAFLAFVEDPANEPQLVEWGLARPRLVDQVDEGQGEPEAPAGGGA